MHRLTQGPLHTGQNRGREKELVLQELLDRGPLGGVTQQAALKHVQQRLVAQRRELDGHLGIHNRLHFLRGRRVRPAGRACDARAIVINTWKAMGRQEGRKAAGGREGVYLRGRTDLPATSGGCAGTGCTRRP